jgi:hypothetical protein
MKSYSDGPPAESAQILRQRQQWAELPAQQQCGSDHAAFAAAERALLG